MFKLYLAALLFIPLISLILSNPVENDNQFGCGPMGINGDKVLDLAHREQIIPCCVQHDTCYRTCNKTRARCDCEFYKCIRENCVRRIPISIDCRAYAIKFYTLVRVGGVPSYVGDQRESKCPPANRINELNKPLPNKNISADVNFCEQNN